MQRLTSIAWFAGRRVLQSFATRIYAAHAARQGLRAGHGGVVGLNKLFDPQIVFEYSLAVVSVMFAAGAVMWCGEMLVRLIGLLG